MKQILAKFFEYLEDETFEEGAVFMAQYQNKLDTDKCLKEHFYKKEELESFDDERLASDLAPHIHVIKRFEEKRGSAGKLFIKNGEVTFYYYSTLDYRVRAEFNLVLNEGMDGQSEVAKKIKTVLGNIQMLQEEMTDLWSGLASKEFINTYLFKLKYMKILNFRGVDFIDASGLSLTALRHLQSIGTPFSLDEEIVIEELGEKHQYLSDYVNSKFNKLDEEIVAFLDTPNIELLRNKKSLTFNSEQNRFTLVRINQIVEKYSTHTARLRSENFKNHFQYKALVTPIREVRSAIDENRLEAEIGQLDEFKLHLSNLLETVEAGSMMTYPDHTLMMEKIFKTMSLERYKQKASALQVGLKDSRAKSMELIKKINEYGLSDPEGDFKLYLVLGLAVISTTWLIYDNYAREKDK